MLHNPILESRVVLAGAVLALGVVLPASASNKASVYNDVSSSASSGADGEARAEVHVRTIINGEEVLDTTKSETGESASVTINEVVVVPEYEYQQPQQPKQENIVQPGPQNPISVPPVPSPEIVPPAAATEEPQSVDVKVSNEEILQSDDQEPTGTILTEIITIAGDVAKKIKQAIEHAVDYLFA